MSGRNTIIIDLTTEDGRIVSLGGDRNGIRPLLDFTIPWRVAIRTSGNNIVTLAGEDSIGAVENEQVLVFDNLNVSLPRIKDEHLQGLIISAFWQSLSSSLTRRGLLADTGSLAAYVIVGSDCPASVVERFRSACASDQGLKLAGFISEAACLITWFVGSELMRELLVESEYQSQSVCFVVAEKDDDVAVCCFELAKENHVEPHVLIRDFYRTTCFDLKRSFERRDWIDEVSAVVSIDPAESLSMQSAMWIENALKHIPARIFQKHISPLALQNLKITGAARIIGATTRCGEIKRSYNIETAYNIGLQINQNQFYPIISKAYMAEADRFPLLAKQTFSLGDRRDEDMTINLCCGYSDRISEASIVCNITVGRDEIVRMIDRRTIVVANVKLDSPGRGEFALLGMPENRLIASERFTLPALVV